MKNLFIVFIAFFLIGGIQAQTLSELKATKTEKEATKKNIGRCF